MPQTPKIQKEYTLFGAGQVAEISGVSVSLQRHWRRRGLMPDIEPGKNAKYGPGEVLHMMIMRTFSDSNISIKAARALTLKAKDLATRILRTLPGAVDIVAGPGVPSGLIAKERQSLEDYRAMWRCRYLVVPLPEIEDASGETRTYEREDLSDLYQLIDEDSFNALVIDVEAIARAFLSRAKRTSPRPLETLKITLEEDPPSI